MLTLSGLYLNEQEFDEEYIELAEEFLKNGVEYSSRKDTLINHIKFKNCEVKIHLNGKYKYIEGNYGRLESTNNLMINLPMPKLKFIHLSKEPEIIECTKWEIIRTNNYHKSEVVLRLGDLSIEEVEEISLKTGFDIK